MLPFADRLQAAVRRCRNPVLVGLDPGGEPARGNSALAGRRKPGGNGRGLWAFCRGVIDVVAPLVPAVKPQAAFFEQLGPAGMSVLAEVIAYAQQKGLLVILDGKRNDIGSTAAAYAEGMLGAGGQSPWGADALTVSPYLGDDSLRPFVEVAAQRGGRGVCAGQDVEPRRRDVPGPCGRGPAALRHVAEYVERQAAETAAGLRLRGGGGGGRGHLSGPVGRTLRGSMPHTWFLVPGFGSQGGTAGDVAAAFDARGRGRDRQQFARHHLRPRRQALRRAVRRRPLARGRRGRHARHDRAASRRNAGGKL